MLSGCKAGLCQREQHGYTCIYVVPHRTILFLNWHDKVTNGANQHNIIRVTLTAPVQSLHKGGRGERNGSLLGYDLSRHRVLCLDPGFIKKQFLYLGY